MRETFAYYSNIPYSRCHLFFFLLHIYISEAEKLCMSSYSVLASINLHFYSKFKLDHIVCADIFVNLFSKISNRNKCALEENSKFVIIYSNFNLNKSAFFILFMRFFLFFDLL